ncbi:hypothetical protein J1605_013652, partial [Eschrichtius robustus]
VFDAVSPTYSNFKSSFAKRLSAEVPVASSPITTRWQQSQTRDVAAHSFGEEHSTTDLPETVLKITPEKETLIPGEVIKMPQAGFEILKKRCIPEKTFVLQKYLMSRLVNCFSLFLPLNKKSLGAGGRGGLKQNQKKLNVFLAGSYKEPLKTPNKGSFETNNSALHFCKASHALDRGKRKTVASKGQVGKERKLKISHLEKLRQLSPKCENCSFLVGCSDGVRDEYFHIQRFSDINYSILQPEVKIHLTALRNDYYLNILDWNFQNLVAIALGSSVYIWNGDNHNRIENIDLSVTCNYISSVSWTKEGSCLAVGTSEGEVQVLDTFFFLIMCSV